MFGYTGRGGDRSVDPDDHPGRSAGAKKTRSWRTIRAGRAVTHFETLRQRKDGTLIDISLTVSPVPRRRRPGRRRVENRPRHQRSQASAPSLDRRLARGRRIVRRRDHHQGSRQHHHVVEPGRRADVRLHGGRGDRPVDPHAHPGRSAERRRRGPRPDPGRRASITTRRFGSARTAPLSISLTVSPIRDERGEIIGASKIARDITEQDAPARAGARARRRSPRSWPRSAPSSRRRSIATPSCRRSPTRAPS